ncbi:lipid-A-disaccharide synthase N-terminal domain-containing protein [Breoghania sp. JC706]|uniref:lipid-A-disaccharide synthase N-terminal domain-containing protein n=1 Tax=Breoghania sp. JC706 TaxID=3117732 RepID=UPI00300B8607
MTSESWLDGLAQWAHQVFVLQFDVWVLLGFVAQAMFMMRFVVQWIASERVGKSIVPVAFWFFSVAGGILLLVYSLIRKDPVFIAGQALGLVIYFRNIYFIFREKKEALPPQE